MLNSPLHAAAYSGDVAGLQEMLKEGTQHIQLDFPSICVHVHVPPEAAHFS